MQAYTAAANSAAVAGAPTLNSCVKRAQMMMMLLLPRIVQLWGGVEVAVDITILCVVILK